MTERPVTPTLGVWPDAVVSSEHPRSRPSPHVAQLVLPPAFERDDPQLVGRLAALAGDTVVCVWVSTNQTGRLGRLRFPGQATVVDPDGRILARTGTRGGTALAGVDVAEVVGRLRAEISHLDDRVEPSYAMPRREPIHAVA